MKQNRRVKRRRVLEVRVVPNCSGFYRTAEFSTEGPVVLALCKF